MQYSMAGFWLFIGILLSLGLTFLISLLSWIGFAEVLGAIFLFLLALFLCCLPYLGLLLFRRWFIIDQPAGRAAGKKSVKR